MMEKVSRNIYQVNGYEDRGKYLESVAEDHGVPINIVVMMAELLGPNEDFDGLISELNYASHLSYRL